MNPEAYHLYLKGRYFLNKRTVDDLRRGIESLTQAVAKEPRFAAAHAALADSYGLLTEYHGATRRGDLCRGPRRRHPRPRAGRRSGRGAHRAGYVKHYYEWDWAGAEAEYRRALALNPGHAAAHQRYAELLSAMGRHDEALAEIRRAADNDPLSLIVNSVEAYLLYMARRYDESIEQCRKVIDLDPNFPEVYIYLKRALDEKGSFDEAVEARQARRRLLGLNGERSEALRSRLRPPTEECIGESGSSRSSRRARPKGCCRSTWRKSSRKLETARGARLARTGLRRRGLHDGHGARDPDPRSAAQRAAVPGAARQRLRGTGR